MENSLSAQSSEVAVLDEAKEYVGMYSTDNDHHDGTYAQSLIAAAAAQCNKSHQQSSPVQPLNSDILALFPVVYVPPAEQFLGHVKGRR